MRTYIIDSRVADALVRRLAEAFSKRNHVVPGRLQFFDGIWKHIITVFRH